MYLWGTDLFTYKKTGLLKFSSEYLPSFKLLRKPITDLWCYLRLEMDEGLQSIASRKQHSTRLLQRILRTLLCKQVWKFPREHGMVHSYPIASGIYIWKIWSNSGSSLHPSWSNFKSHLIQVWRYCHSYQYWKITLRELNI